MMIEVWREVGRDPNVIGRPFVSEGVRGSWEAFFTSLKPSDAIYHWAIRTVQKPPAVQVILCREPYDKHEV